jgi:hypothetical protein
MLDFPKCGERRVRMAKKREIENNEAIKNLLIVGLLKDNVDPKIIETATGISEKTIRNKFPMKLIKESKGNDA